MWPGAGAGPHPSSPCCVACALLVHASFPRLKLLEQTTLCLGCHRFLLQAEMPTRPRVASSYRQTTPKCTQGCRGSTRGSCGLRGPNLRRLVLDLVQINSFRIMPVCSPFANDFAVLRWHASTSLLHSDPRFQRLCELLSRRTICCHWCFV